MKTRQELILDFMLALAAGVFPARDNRITAETVYKDAAELADKYLEKVA
jgi:hypothetical protein